MEDLYLLENLEGQGLNYEESQLALSIQTKKMNLLFDTIYSTNSWKINF